MRRRIRCVDQLKRVSGLVSIFSSCGLVGDWHWEADAAKRKRSPFCVTERSTGRQLYILSCKQHEGAFKSHLALHLPLSQASHSPAPR